VQYGCGECQPINAPNAGVCVQGELVITHHVSPVWIDVWVDVLTFKYLQVKEMEHGHVCVRSER
jgi:hypothetical protein